MLLRDVLRVLVVDDMSTSRGLMLQALDNLGIGSVSHADSGNAGMQAARLTRPHLILSDLHMPDLNGLEMLQRLRMDPVTKEIGFVLVTGRATDAVIRAGRGLGMNNLLQKPFDLVQLKACIESVVGRL